MMVYSVDAGGNNTRLRRYLRARLSILDERERLLLEALDASADRTRDDTAGHLAQAARIAADIARR